jgi:hypothetical protein
MLLSPKQHRQSYGLSFAGHLSDPSKTFLLAFLTSVMDWHGAQYFCGLWELFAQQANAFPRLYLLHCYPADLNILVFIFRFLGIPILCLDPVHLLPLSGVMEGFAGNTNITQVVLLN